MPKRSTTARRSSSVVAGVIRSTIEFGNVTCWSIHSPSSGSRRRAKVVNASRARLPFSCRLSHDITVNGPVPRSRRRRSASVTSPNVVFGVASGSRSALTAGSSGSNSPVTSLML